ncbi:acyltransferase family protein [Gordonia sp. JH63]|uniref:acyltransferase family protein n=1 Tax=Gordonia sp. JH63 TaxID=2698900 RepID=UPI00131FBC20|nr:acyltransferase [Gordonia sp. JH63]QHD84818.1 acyltransferase family protein [Gordonia sp. JH63]
MTEELARPGGTVPPAAAGGPTTPAAATPQRGRIRGLDGPRGLACWAVVIVHVAVHHSPDTMSRGGLQLLGQALIFFFALSGFLLYLPYVRDLLRERQSPPDVRMYLTHRVLRVFPAYLAIFLVVNFVLQASFLANEYAVSETGEGTGTGMITDPWMLLTNLSLTQTYFPQYLQTGISPAWSLTLELVFYVSLPLFGMAMWWLRRRFGTHAALLVVGPPVLLIIVGTIGKLVAGKVAAAEGITDVTEQNWGPNAAAVILRSFFAASDNFAFGMLATAAFVAVGAGHISARIARRLRVGAVIALVPSLMAMLLLIAAGSSFQSTFTALASALVILIIVLPLASGQDSRLASVLDWKPFDYSGQVSLSIYLWHFPLIIVLGRLGWLQGDSVPGLAINIALVGAVSLVFASLSYHYVEKPAMTLARKLRTR